MFTIIGGDGKEYGPVSVEQLRQWMAENRVRHDTQARRVGTEAWQPLGTFPEFGSMSGSPPPAGAGFAMPPLAAIAPSSHR